MKKIYIIEGNMAQRQSVIHRLKESMGDYDLFTFDKDDKLDAVVHKITELSCFGELRLFLIKEMPSVEASSESAGRTKALTAFQKVIPHIPDGNVVVFDNLNISSKKILDLAEQYGKVFNYDQTLPEMRARGTIRSILEENYVVTDEQLDVLTNSLLSNDKVNIDELNLLVLKLKSYVGNRKKITDDDVYQVCSHSKEFIIWYLYDLLDKKDLCSALLVVNDMLSRAKDRDSEIIAMISQMSWRYQLLLLASSGLNNGESQEEIKEKLSNMVKIERTGLSQNMTTSAKIEKEKEVPQYSQGMLYSIFNGRTGVDPVRCYNADRLQLINYALYKALLKIRVGCTSSELSIIIEFILMTICNKIKKYSTLDILESKNLLIIEQMKALELA